MGTGRPLTEEQVRYVRAHFHEMRNQDLADAIGASKSAVSRVQHMYGLRKSKEHDHMMASKAGKVSASRREGAGIEMTPEVIAKRTASYKRTFREEKIRYKWGLPQLTKMRVKTQPRKKTRQRSYLKSLGYILDEDNNIAYYTPKTTRAVRMEAQPKLYYQFLPYEQQ